MFWIFSVLHGACGAAVKHYEETGKRFPLAVKLGTITPKGNFCGFLENLNSYSDHFPLIDGFGKIFVFSAFCVQVLIFLVTQKVKWLKIHY